MPDSDSLPLIITVEEAATALRVSRSTVWRWCQDGTFVSAFKIGRNWRIRRTELETIIEQNLPAFEDKG